MDAVIIIAAMVVISALVLIGIAVMLVVVCELRESKRLSENSKANR